MKVKELIEKLQAFDPELTVCLSDSEDGTQVVSDLGIDDDAWIGWDKATVVTIWGDYPEERHIDPKYFRKQERIVREPSPLNAVLANAYRDVLKRQLERDTLFFSRLSHPANNGAFVEFKIVKKGDKE